MPRQRCWWRGEEEDGARRPGPEGLVLRHVLWSTLRHVMRRVLRRVLYVLVGSFTCHLREGVGGSTARGALEGRARGAERAQLPLERRAPVLRREEPLREIHGAG